MDKTTEEILWLSPEEFRKQAKFGDVIVNHWAGDGNPNKRCRFVRTIFRRGKMNGGLHAELISDSGDTVLIGLQGSRLSIESLPPQQAVSDEEIDAWSFSRAFNMNRVDKARYEARIEGAKWMRDRTPPSEAETILREIMEADDRMRLIGNRDVSLEQRARAYREARTQYENSKTAARKWCADNPVKG